MNHAEVFVPFFECFRAGERKLPGDGRTELETLTHYLSHVFRDFNRNQDGGELGKALKLILAKGWAEHSHHVGVDMACVM